MEHVDEVRRGVDRGVRWTLVVNFLTIPLSFATNAILGHTSASALGIYSAIQLYASFFEVFVFPGGREVFARFLPGLDRIGRIGFVFSYVVMVVGIVAGSALVLWLFLPRVLSSIVDYFRAPTSLALLGVGAAFVFWAISSNYLYGVLRGDHAILTLRGAVVGFFVLAVLARWALPRSLTDDPASILWWGAVGVYAVGAVVGVALAMRTPDLRPPLPWTLRLPAGFGTAVVYTHLVTIVQFSYNNLAQSIVLAWLDLESLARLHASLRFPALVGTFPTMAGAVLAPAIAAFASRGDREGGLRQATIATNAALLLVYPATIVLIFFAGDAMSLFNPSFREDADLLRITALRSISTPIIQFGTSAAVALGAFRSYLSASFVFVASTLVGALVLVPAFGLIGAAIAATAGGLIHQVALGIVLRRRLGIRFSRRIVHAWGWALIACALAAMTSPGRLLAAAEAIFFVLAFAVSARVYPSEITSLARRIVGRRERS